MKNVISYDEFLNEKIYTYQYKVVLNNGQECVFGKNDFKEVIKFLYDNKSQGEWVEAPIWSYEEKPDLNKYCDIYRELSIELEKPYISAQGGFYIGDKEELYDGEKSIKKLYIGNIYTFRPWNKYKEERLNQSQLKQRDLGYERFLP
jgi:hypothetical protein